MKKKVLYSVLSTAAITSLFVTVLTTTASAKVTDVVVNDKDGKSQQYNYNALKASYALDGMLYKDYMGKTPVAYFDDVQQKYISVNDVKLAYSLDTTGKFDMNKYTESLKAKVQKFDSSITVRSEKDGKIIDESVVTPEQKVTVSSVSAINATDVTVKFAAPITEAQAKETTLIFVKGDKEYTATATLAKDATDAKFIFTAALTEDGEYVVKGTQVKATLTVFAEKADAEIAKKVIDAKDLIELRTALSNPVFKDVDNNKLLSIYKGKITGLKAELKTTKDIQEKVIYEVNVTDKVKEAIKASSSDDGLALYDSIEYGSKVGVLKNVDLNKYMSAYKEAAKAPDIDVETVANIQKNIIDPADQSVAGTAKINVTTAKETLKSEDIKIAEEAIAKVSPELIDGDKKNVKEELTKKLEDVKVVKVVNDSLVTKDQAKILEVIKANFERVNSEFKVAYSNDIKITKSSDKYNYEVKDIQAMVDAVNTAEVEKVVASANMQLDSTKVTEARTLVNTYLLDVKTDTITLKGYYIDLLDLEDSMIAVVTAKTDSDLKTALGNLDTLENKLVTKYTGSKLKLANKDSLGQEVAATVPVEEFDVKTVKDGSLTQYKDAIAKAENKDKNQRKDIQTIVNTVNGISNVQVATDAVNALFAKTADDKVDNTKLAEKVDQAAVDVASKLVEALPADSTTQGDPTPKKDLQDKIKEAQVLVNETNTKVATDAVNALFAKTEDGNVDNTKLAEKVDQAAVDVASKLVEALPADSTTQGDPTPKKDLQAKIKEAQVLVNKTNTKVATDAVNALFAKTEDGNVDNTKLAEKVDQAAVNIANKLVEALPADSTTQGDPTPKKDLQDKIKTAQELLDVTNINAAITAKDAVALKDSLVKLDAIEYNNLTKTQCIEVAQMIIDSTKDPVTDTVTVKSTVGTTVTNYKKLLEDVNKADSKTNMKNALIALGYDKYNTANQLDVAEAMLNNVTAKDFVEYKTIAEIKTAIDVAIENPIKSIKGDTITVNAENAKEGTLTIGQ